VATEPEVTLSVNGSVHEGWKSATIRSSIEELAHSFTVEYTQRWSSSGEPVPIHSGDAVQIRIGDTLALTGIVDETSEDYDASSHTVSVTGRSKTGQLFDCSVVHKGGAIKGKNLQQVAELLCKPFGITVSLSDPELDVGDAVDVQIQDGASVFETLSEIARKEGVLLLSDAAGNLVLARASSTPLASLELRTGENIKRGSLRSSTRERYSTYILKGQARSSDALSGSAATQLRHEVVDDAVKTYRPLVIVESNTTLALMQQRGAWERNTRAGRALALTYDVQGWTNIYGLWKPNTLLRVVDTFLGLDTELLVTTVDLSRTLDGGRTARLELAPRETFDVLKPPKAPKRKKKSSAAALGL
jgi:prophage tail gpP-like protein